MIMKVRTSDACDMFRAYDRDYYTWDGIESILNYYDDIDENLEFDVIAICGEWTEYGPGACESFYDFIQAYSDEYPERDYMNDNELKHSDDIDEQEYAKAIAERLEDRTTILYPDNGNILVGTF